MVNVNGLVWGIIIFFLGLFVFWFGNRLRLKPLNWIGIITLFVGCVMAIISVLP